MQRSEAEQYPVQQLDVLEQLDPVLTQELERQVLPEQRPEQHDDDSEQLPPVEVQLVVRHNPLEHE